MYGTQRFVVDGIEPQSDRSDSLQLDLLESIYHRMLRKEHDWLAREVFRNVFANCRLKSTSMPSTTRVLPPWYW